MCSNLIVHRVHSTKNGNTALDARLRSYRKLQSCCFSRNLWTFLKIVIAWFQRSKHQAQLQSDVLPLQRRECMRLLPKQSLDEFLSLLNLSQIKADLLAIGIGNNLEKLPQAASSTNTTQTIS